MYLDLVNYNLLAEEVKKSGDSDYIEILDDICQKCLDYMNSVEAHSKAIELIRFRYDADELKDRIREADLHRHIIHETAISNCNLLNRLADTFHIGKVFTGNVENRFEVADFCMEVYQNFEGKK